MKKVLFTSQPLLAVVAMAGALLVAMSSPAAAQRITLDSETRSPSGGQAASYTVVPSTPSALSTSSRGLVISPSPVAGGGMVVDLQGRFQSIMSASVDENGELRVGCVPGTAPGGVETPTEDSGEFE